MRRPAILFLCAFGMACAAPALARPEARPATTQSRSAEARSADGRAAETRSAGARSAAARPASATRHRAAQARPAARRQAAARDGARRPAARPAPSRAAGTARPQASRAQARHAAKPPGRHARAGATQRGQASVYARRFTGRRMADGTRFDPRAPVVASRTLPLGSHARVTNLRNGRSIIVQVRDRGPHHRRRIVDLSPGVAAQLGMDGGLAPVEVTPLTLASRAEAATPDTRR